MLPPELISIVKSNFLSILNDYLLKRIGLLMTMDLWCYISGRNNEIGSAILTSWRILGDVMVLSTSNYFCGNFRSFNAGIGFCCLDIQKWCMLYFPEATKKRAPMVRGETDIDELVFLAATSAATDQAIRLWLLSLNQEFLSQLRRCGLMRLAHPMYETKIRRP